MERKALKPLFDEIVDAIHEKDGQTDGIAASQFPERIRAIPTGGNVTLEGIEITAPPNKVNYGAGELFDPTGMSVWASFSNGYGLYVNHSDLVFDPAGPLEVGTEAVAVRFSWGGETAETTQRTHVHAGKIYGVEWDGTSTTKLSRTDDAAGFVDPVPAVGTKAGSSPFDDLMPWSGMVRETQDGNELVAIPKYWVKVSHGPFRVQISTAPNEGFQTSPAHRDRGDGQGERDVVYIGRYECDSSYMSRSGQTPKVSITLAAARNGIAALGADYWQADYALQLTWWYLYLVEFADWNGQAAIGIGRAGASSQISTGKTGSMPYHTGRAAGTDGQTAVQYRNIENLWGNVREWRDGIIFSNENICTYNNPCDFSDVYNGKGAAVRGNKRGMTGGWIKAWGHDPGDTSFIYPSEAGGTDKTFIPDYVHTSSEEAALVVSGAYSDSAPAIGPFLLYGHNGASQTANILGSRLMKLPNKEAS